MQPLKIWQETFLLAELLLFAVRFRKLTFTNEMKLWSLQLCLRFKQSQLSPKYVFGASTGFEPMASALALQCSTRVSNIWLNQLSYEDPNVGSRAICWIHRTRERNETYKYYVNYGHIHLFQKTLSERTANGSCRTEIARPKGTVVSILMSSSRGAKLTTATQTPQICMFDNEKQSFCTLCTCIFHLLTF